MQKYINGFKILYILSPLKKVQFCSRPRKAKILTTNIPLVFRGLKFEPVGTQWRSRLSGTQGLEKRGRFSKGSK